MLMMFLFDHKERSQLVIDLFHFIFKVQNCGCVNMGVDLQWEIAGAVLTEGGKLWKRNSATETTNRAEHGKYTSQSCD